MLARHPTPELRSDPPPQGEGGYQPPPVSPHPEAGAKRYQKDEGGWLRRPRSFEALGLRGRLRMRGSLPSLRRELRWSAPSDDSPALVPRHRPSPPTSPLRGEVAAKRRVGVTTSAVCSRFTPPRSSAPTLPLEGRVDARRRPQLLSLTIGQSTRVPLRGPLLPVSPRPEAQAIPTHLPLEGGGRREAAGGGVTTSPAASRFTLPRSFSPALRLRAQVDSP